MQCLLQTESSVNFNLIADINIYEYINTSIYKEKYICLFQTSTNDSECSGTTGLQGAQKNPLHLSSSPCTGYQWQLASSSRHWCLHTERPQAQHPPTSTHYYESTSPPEVWDLLVSDALWYHHREAQNHSPEHSRSPFLDGGIIFPPLSGMLDPCQSSSNNRKLISFGTTWLLPKLVLKKKKKKLSLYLSLLPLLACTYLNNDWDLVLRALPLSDCLFKMNRFMYSPIVSRFG